MLAQRPMAMALAAAFNALSLPTDSKPAETSSDVGLLLGETAKDQEGDLLGGLATSASVQV